MNEELKPIDQLLEEDRQAKIAAYKALPFVSDLVREDQEKAMALGCHVNDL